MNKFSKPLSVLLSTAVGLSFHASSFKSFGIDNIVPKSDKEAREKNILDRNDLENFKGKKLYRTSENTLVNESCIPLSRNGELAEFGETTTVVPEALLASIPLHPVLNFLNSFEKNKFIFQVPAELSGYPIAMIVNDEGKILTFDKNTEKCEFTDNKEKMTTDSVVKIFPRNLYEFKNLSLLDASSPNYDKVNALSEVYREHVEYVHRELNKLVNEIQAFKERIKKDSETDKEAEKLYRERLGSECLPFLCFGMCSIVLTVVLVNVIEGIDKRADVSDMSYVLDDYEND